MSAATRQHQGLRQQNTLTPTLIHSLSLLAMSSSELIREIEKEGQENPVLTIKPVAGGGGLVDAASQHETEAPENLRESLLRQLAMLALDDDVRLVATYLAGDLTNEGYLSSNDNDIAKELSLPVTLVRRGIRALQSCEPSGIAARSLAECLELQLVDQSVAPDTAAFVTANLALFAARKWPELSRLSQMSEHELRALSDHLVTLNPHPAERFAPLPQSILPDLIVRTGQGAPIVELSNDALPKLSLDNVLLARARHDSEARQYLARHKQRAISLISALKYRSESLIAITGEIMRVQHRFFAGDLDFLEPLTRKEVADACNLSAATAGRLIARKYLELDGRVYPLSHFVTSKVRSLESGYISSHFIQRRIIRFIRSENPDVPLSDAQITDQLRREGVDITRRTVAKYRGCMNIPSSFRRRQIHKAKTARSI